jgi:hypothetical protein
MSNPKNDCVNHVKPFTVLTLIQNPIISTAHYFKKDGTLCCIVLKYSYL